jgi:hypothetical protein
LTRRLRLSLTPTTACILHFASVFNVSVKLSLDLSLTERLDWGCLTRAWTVSLHRRAFIRGHANRSWSSVQNPTLRLVPIYKGARQRQETPTVEFLSLSASPLLHRGHDIHLVVVIYGARYVIRSKPIIS